MGSAVSPEDLHATASHRLRSKGQRYTASRRAVVQTLSDADRPLTIPEILGVNPSLAQSSAYRNLTELIDAGVVHRIIVGDEYSHFELAEDLTSHHHHLVCTSCGGVADVTLSEELEVMLDRSLAVVARRHGFLVEHHRLDMLGRCRACA